MPTEQEIARAKDYLLLRLRAERLVVSELDTALLSAARRIVEISRRYNIPPESFRFSANPSLLAEVNQVLALLRDALYDHVATIDTFKDGENDTPFVAPVLTTSYKNKTFRQRLAEYTSRWGYELEATIAAAGLEGIKDQGKILAVVRQYLDRPYDNPWIKEHMGKGDAVRLENIPHYGKGNPIASATALSVLLTTLVAKGWMQNWARLNEGKRGYYVYRGSSFPCEICDAQVGFLHAANDLEGMPPYHPRCCCYVVYTNEI